MASHFRIFSLTTIRGAFVEFGKRIGYPPDLCAHSVGLRLHRMSAGAYKRRMADAVPWFSGLNEIMSPERRLVAVTYEDGRAGQANEFEANLVCSMVQLLFLQFSRFLDGENDPRRPGNGA